VAIQKLTDLHSCGLRSAGNVPAAGKLPGRRKTMHKRCN
jgi:hypothetical protein